MKHGHSIESSLYAGKSRPDRFGMADADHARFQGVSVVLDHLSGPLAQIRERTRVRLADHGQGVLDVT
jgi:hypothetical protein